LNLNTKQRKHLSNPSPNKSLEMIFYSRPWWDSLLNLWKLSCMKTSIQLHLLTLFLSWFLSSQTFLFHIVLSKRLISSISSHYCQIFFRLTSENWSVPKAFHVCLWANETRNSCPRNQKTWGKKKQEIMKKLSNVSYFLQT